MASPLILLIDDNRSWSEAAGSVLEAEGYEVRTAEDGQQGLDLLAQVAPLLVIVDLHMPRRSGLDVLRALRRAMPHPPVLMLSAAAEADEIGKAIAEGATAFLSKPLSADLLRQTVRRLMWTSLRQLLIPPRDPVYYLTCVPPAKRLTLVQFPAR